MSNITSSPGPRRGFHVRKHPLIDSFLNLKGNPRACLITEPLWGIPYNLAIPFFSLYMSALGVSDQQIGLRLSLGLFLQIFTAFLGGAITDKLGRRLSTLIFDAVAWVIPAVIYVFAQDYRYFIAGVIFNSIFQVTMISWNCLLVEDAPRKELVNIFTWVTLAGLFSVFIAPLASLLVAQLGIVTSMRILTGFFAVVVSIKIILTYLWTTETETGKIRMEATRDVPMRTLLHGYSAVFKSMIHHPGTRTVLAIMVLINMTIHVTNSFFSLFAIQDLGLPEHYAGYFPIARALIMLVFIFVIQSFLNRLRYQIPLGIGLILYMLAQVALIFSPHSPYVGVAVYVLLDSFAYALVIPQRDGLSARILEPMERARSLAIIQMVTQGLAAPFLTFAGYLSEQARIYPFIFNLIAFTICFFLIRRQELNEEHQAVTA